MTTTERVGFLVNGTHVRCMMCGFDHDGDRGVPLHSVNIGQYGQTCHVCRLPIRRGFPGWPELFHAGDCKICQDTLDVPPLYAKIRGHYGHKIVIASYGEGEEYAVECEDCSTVVVSCNRTEGG